ncbi:beta-ketoacyl synthase N-terminal-like domain-containing protein [Kitasatospora sp. NPDC101157]|uniref:beta-ketoacyl synthase N-terminal-like domain-containing protein n=1 Tax=Kitasatospora sp. NPDC101157 TaxID=3364098 RepID=UPI0038160647
MTHGQKYAVVGMGCLFPEAATVEEFWQNLCRGRDSRTDGTEEIFERGVPGGPAARPGDRHRIYSTRGAFVRGFSFDPTGYRLPADYLSALDRIFQWSLHASRDALADAGHDLGRDAGHDAGDGVGRMAGARADRAGIVLGNAGFPSLLSTRHGSDLWLAAVGRGLAEAGFDPGQALASGAGGGSDPLAAAHNLWVGGMPARVVAAALGIGGPQLAVDGACASGLYALKLACDHLSVGRADVMLAGAVGGQELVGLHLAFSDLRAYPEDGRCQPFDARSSGALTGQGAGMLVVKRLADARRDGDRIHAVIEGAALTNDGTGRHTLVPQRAGQVDAYRRAYGNAGVDPSTVQYLECHATGTRLGDGVELSGINEFFGASGTVPYLGSVKSNLGHLLTGAGMPGLIKTILAIRYGVIPPTPGVAEPLADTHGRLARENTDFPRTGRPRTAAVSSFGFGGTNAHVVLSEPAEPSETAAAPEAPRALPRLDILGLGCHVGPFADAGELERAVYEGRDGFGPLPERRWRGLAPGHPLPDGAYIDSFDCDTARLRVPPIDLEGFNEQQLLFVRVAEEALLDAGYRRQADDGGPPPARRVAVVVAAEMNPVGHSYAARHDLGGVLRRRCEELALTGDAEAVAALVEGAQRGIGAGWSPNAVLSYLGITATRVSSLWNFTGPAFTVAADSTGAASALEAAALVLLDESVEAVLVGAVDFTGNVENMLARFGLAAYGGAPGLGIGGGGPGWRAGEGAAALLLTRAGDRRAPGRPAYATIDALSIRYAPSPAVGLAADAEQVRLATLDALGTAGITPGEVDYVELHSTGVPEQDAAELEGLARVWAGQGPAEGGTESAGKRTTALGSVSANVGDTQLAAVLVGIVKVALCLHRAYLPAVPGWSGPSDGFSATLSESAFFVPDRSRPWLRAARRGPRRAVVNGLGTGGAHVSVVLSGASVRGDVTAVEGPDVHGQLILAVGGADFAELMHRVAEVRDATGDRAELRRVATEVAAVPEHAHRLVLCAARPDVLRREAERALARVPRAHAAGTEWTTPAGSHYTPTPIGGRGRVALVFPGMLSAYPGVGAELFRTLPGLLPIAEAAVPDAGELMREDLLFRRRVRPADAEEAEAAATALMRDFSSMVDIGSSFAWLQTQALRRLLGVPVHGAFGYSLGESSMLYALGACSPASHGREQRARLTEVFQGRLSGPKTAVREAWALPETTADADVWSGFVLFEEVAKVRAAVRRYDRVFVTHVNTPVEVVISGDPAQCRAVVDALGCRNLASGVSHVLHCPLPDAGELADCLRRETRPVTDVELYSANGYAPLTDFGARAVAENNAATLRRTVDFPRLVETLYARGYRYFVEVGPGGTCSRWIRETLTTRSHVAASVDRRRTSTASGIGRVLAQLAAHGLPVDLSPYLPEPPRGTAARALSIRQTTPGGPPVAESVAENSRAAIQRLRPSSEAPEEQPAITFPGRLRRTAAAAPDGRRGPTAGDGPPAAAPPAGRRKPPGVVLDEQDLMEFANGEVGKAFGPEYAPIDAFARRVRLPAEPYHFVSRVTALEAERGRFGPSFIRTEYDVPVGAWYSVDGQVPFGVLAEAGQCDLVLISYMGIDFENRGERVYRLLDGSLTPYGSSVREGQRIRCDIHISNVLQTNGPTLTFFHYDCFVDGELAFTMRNGCAGFFTDRELAEAGGIIGAESKAPAEEPAGRAARPSAFKPLARTDRTKLDGEDIAKLTQGRFAEVFGPAYRQEPGANRSLRLNPTRLLMVDEVPWMGLTGGAHGRGSCTSIKRLDPDEWYFTSHFVGDPVMPGTLVAEGAMQALQVYGLHAGLHLCLPDATYQPVKGLTTTTKVRGQISPATREIRYEIDIVDIGLVPRPFVVADVLVHADDLPVARISNVGFQLVEKPGTPFRPDRRDRAPRYLGRSGASGEPAVLNEMHVAHVARGDHAMLGEQFEVCRELPRVPRLPSGELCFVDRVLRVDAPEGAVRPGVVVESEYDVPADAWYFTENNQPYMPHFASMEAGVQPGVLGPYYLGTTLRFPETEYYLRNLGGHATALRQVDLRGRTVRQRVTILSNDAVGGAILHRADWELSVDGEVFHTGEQLSGYFTGELRAGSVGLDQGRPVPLWLDSAGPGAGAAVEVDLDALRARTDSLRLGTGRLDMLDGFSYVPGGGLHGAGYLRGHRNIGPDDWYFPLHFHQDPVMPGSLGAETVYAGLRAYAMVAEPARHRPDARFDHAPGIRTSWTYRGEFAPTHPRLDFEAHLKEVREQDGRRLLIADAGVWRGELRVYEFKDIAIAVVTGGGHR